MKSKLKDVLDYGESGLTIQDALMDHVTRFPEKNSRPEYILWNGIRIWTADSIPVPQKGVVRAEFLSADPLVRQGFDLKLGGGWVELADGEHVPLLRTWREEEYEDVVEYPYFSRDGFLWTWNVYEIIHSSGQKTEDKWTGNAGFWVESISDFERVYHCSHWMASPPDFDSLVYKITVRPLNE